MKSLLVVGLLISALAVSGCNRSDVVQRGPEHIEVYGIAAPICEFSDADNLARQIAAIETIERGFDGYIVRKSYAGEGLRIRYFPVEKRFRETVSVPGRSRSKVNAMYIELVKAGDPEMANAVNAREDLGPDWQAAVARGPESNCI